MKVEYMQSPITKKIVFQSVPFLPTGDPGAGHFVEVSLRHYQAWHVILYFILFSLLKGQCHEIFECWFFSSKSSSWSPQWYPGMISFLITEILNKKSAQRCMIPHRMGTWRCILHSGICTKNSLLSFVLFEPLFKLIQIRGKKLQ